MPWQLDECRVEATEIIEALAAASASTTQGMFFRKELRTILELSKSDIYGGQRKQTATKRSWTVVCGHDLHALPRLSRGSAEPFEIQRRRNGRLFFQAAGNR
ncbi:MAG TPA: hypothetical protein VGQ95_05025 [Chthoniobacterales bacterium]|nr:hypothetical protein [Chthoniobacterales bacterium]